jgi:hypothetical protein
VVLMQSCRLQLFAAGTGLARLPVATGPCYSCAWPRCVLKLRGCWIFITQEQVSLLREMIDAGVNAILVKVASAGGPQDI